MTLVFIGAYASIIVYTRHTLNSVEEKVKQHNPEITRVESITSIGHWGEWFSEYSLVVVLDGKKYRVWTNGDGKIGEKVLIE